MSVIAILRVSNPLLRTIMPAPAFTASLNVKTRFLVTAGALKFFVVITSNCGESVSTVLKLNAVVLRMPANLLPAKSVMAVAEILTL